MQKIFTNFISIMIVTALLSGCATQQGGFISAHDSCAVLGPKTSVGILGGAALGTAAGAGIGNNKDRAAAMLIGALVGAVAGGLAGANLDKNDCEKAHLALQKMGKARVGKKIVWSNPDTGNHGTLVPTTKAKKTAQGVCREYQRTTTLKNGQQVGGDTGVTCRDEDGDWEVVS
jgi:surface antigen